jgi:hypothetical protein
MLTFFAKMITAILSGFPFLLFLWALNKFQTYSKNKFHRLGIVGHKVRDYGQWMDSKYVQKKKSIGFHWV